VGEVPCCGKHTSHVSGDEHTRQPFLHGKHFCSPPVKPLATSRYPSAHAVQAVADVQALHPSGHRKHLPFEAKSAAPVKISAAPWITDVHDAVQVPWNTENPAAHTRHSPATLHWTQLVSLHAVHVPVPVFKKVPDGHCE
jgi:hypothetical protein